MLRPKFIWPSLFLGLFLVLLTACVTTPQAPGGGLVTPTSTLPAAGAFPELTLTTTVAPIPTSATGAPILSVTPSPLPLAPLAGEDSERPKITMDVVLNMEDRLLHVTQVVQIVNDTRDPWQEVVFSVMPAHQAHVFSLEQVEVITRGGREVVAATLDGIMLHVPMLQPVQPDEPVMVTLVYNMRVPVIDPAVCLPEGNLGASDDILQAGDWHPTLVPYREGIGWQVWRYHPVGDPVIYPIADYDVQIFTGANVVIAAPGDETRDGVVRRYSLERARCFAFLASPHYEVMEATVAGIPLRSYYLPDYGTAAQATLDTARNAITLYEELYGPYPASGLVIAQNAYWGAMEYSGLVSISDQAFRLYHGNPANRLITLTAHEIAHQWWYGAVGNDQVHDPWLDEAFAKYSELLYLERYTPKLTRWWWEIQVYQSEPEGAVDRTIYDFPNTPVYFDQLYGQAARFLNDLRTQLGDEAFFSFVRAYRQAGEGALVDPQVFFDTLRASTEMDLQPLIDRYFTASPYATPQ